MRDEEDPIVLASFAYINWREGEGERFDAQRNPGLKKAIKQRYLDRILAGKSCEAPDALDGIDWQSTIKNGRMKRVWRAVREAW